MQLKKAHCWLNALFLIFILQCSAYANGINGGRGLNYVKSAWNLNSGHLTFYARSQAFGQIATYSSQSIAVWDIQGAVSLNYGVSDHVEFAIAPVIYQDTNRGQYEYLLPGDLMLSLKCGSYNLKGSHLTLGIGFDTKLPTGKTQNLPFEPYSAGKASWGFTGMVSYSKDPLYPENDFNVDLNLGYLNHNDVGEKLSDYENDQYSVSKMTQQVLYGLGFKIPTITFDFTLEMNGCAFIQPPPKQTAYSVENYLFLSPGINYKASSWLTLKVGVDLLLSSNKDETTYSYINELAGGLPNYPSWRANLGLNVHLLPASVHKISDKDILIKKAESRRELFEQIINEQQKTESAEQELEKIKEERRKAEKELERLRRILEGDQKKPEETTKEPPPNNQL